MRWMRQILSWVRLTFLEGHLHRQGYRRLQEQQVNEARERSKRVIHDLADAVIMLRSVAEQVEGALQEMGEWDDRRL